MAEEKKPAADTDSKADDKSSESKVKDSTILIPSRIDRIPSPDLMTVEQSEDSRRIKKADDQEQCGYEEGELR